MLDLILTLVCIVLTVQFILVAVAAISYARFVHTMTALAEAQDAARDAEDQNANPDAND